MVTLTSVISPYQFTTLRDTSWSMVTSTSVISPPVDGKRGRKGSTKPIWGRSTPGQDGETDRREIYGRRGQRRASIDPARAEREKGRARWRESGVDVFVTADK
ncbi:hypothetical protein J6590_010939 [Homalodisca vitripennis]|nr:hypothetical protein J6590_010939 [Homalodisca vitripennis]